MVTLWYRTEKWPLSNIYDNQSPHYTEVGLSDMIIFKMFGIGIYFTQCELLKDEALIKAFFQTFHYSKFLCINH